MKAIALVSGGLDSTLAIKVAKEQGIEVTPVYFRTSFCQRESFSQLEKNIGQPVKVIDISKEFLELLIDPPHGFGSSMNPCIDCKILMLRKAKELMSVLGASFVITGEVLGQRPMSQNRQALNNIEKKSGLTGLLLRPLSAKLMPETLAEKEGRVDRSKLLNFSGRGRSPHIALAKKFGITEFAAPAGGCLLTESLYAKRIKDLIAHHQLDLENIELTKLGRHFRLSPQAKLIVGRDEKESILLEKLASKEDIVLTPNDVLAGPTALFRGRPDVGLIELAGKITVSYCDLNGKKEAELFVKNGSAEKKLRNFSCLERKEFAALRI